jgi:hypothetical protein
MQSALGGLRDLMLLARWIHRRGLALTPHVAAALDALAKRRLKRCRRHRKPLRKIIRKFLG